MSHNPWHIDDEVPYGHSPDHYNDPYGLLRAEAQGPMAPGSRGVNYNEIGGVLPGLLGGLVQGPYESIKGLLGRGRDFARENPVEAAKIGAEFAVDMSPGVGDVKALYDMGRFAEEGRYGMSAISGLSAMPWFLGLPVGADMIRARANAVDAMKKQSARRADDLSDDFTYRGLHTAPMRGEGSAPLHALDEIYPGDIYGPDAARIYGHRGPNRYMDEEVMRINQAFRGQPDATVTVYRAVPQNASDQINAGDWVTTSREYAEQHARVDDNPLNDFKVVEAEVRADELYTDANSPYEFGYDPGPDTNVVRPRTDLTPGEQAGESWVKATYEQTPGTTVSQTGHLPDVQPGAMSRQQLKEFADEAPWTNEEGSDVLYESLRSTRESAQPPGLLQRPTETNTTGIFEGDVNPGSTAHVDINPELRPFRQPDEVANYVERARAYTDVQTGGAWHRIVDDSPVEELNSIRVTLPDGGRIKPHQVEELNELVEARLGKSDWGDAGVVASDTGDGVTLLNVGGPVQGDELLKIVQEELGDEIDRIVPGSSHATVKTESNYLDFDWSEPGSRKATQKMLDSINTDQVLKRRIEQPLRDKARANYLRDANQGGTVRKDIQNARRIFFEGGFDALQKAIDSKAVLPSVAILGGLGLTRYMDIQEPGT